ncbi:carbohydrate porin [Swingsia samuiensis]|uniref:Carbohydrate porin n=2 Tax=Swingsia samuiensis TaxID=1293412 RepID=A0A4Y6UK38_9PROT|nr:carbohydrate porin [Swingsia samuiensis]
MIPVWGRLNKKLNRYGVGLVVDYTSESALALNGGHSGDAGYAHQIGVELDLDWEKLIGWKGFKTHTVMVNRAGHNLATDFRDYSLNGFQEIFGGGGNVGVHLVYVYGTQDLYNKRIQISAGKMPVNIDFANSPLFCTFMNKSNCGIPKSLTKGAAGYATYPGSTWGARIRYWMLHGFYMQAGLYGVNPGLNTNRYDRTGFNMSVNRYTGVYIPYEIGFIPSFGPHKLVGHYKFGVAYDSSSYRDVYYDSYGQPAALTGEPYRWTRGKVQMWLEGDQMLIRNGWGPLHGLYALAGWTHNQSENGPYSEQIYAGIVNRGMFKSRPKDTFGIEWSRTFASEKIKATQWIQHNKGIESLSGNATYPQSYVMTFEVTYNIHVWSGVSIQPDYQHIWRPNLQKNYKDIDALGLKIHTVL